MFSSNKRFYYECAKAVRMIGAGQGLLGIILDAGAGITIFLLGSSIYFTHFPIILLLFMILVSVIPFLGSIPKSWTLSIYSKQVLHAIINVMIVSKLYYLLSYWYFILNCKLTLKPFKVFTICNGLLFLFYLLSARYILYLKLEGITIHYALYITLLFVLYHAL